MYFGGSNGRARLPDGLGDEMREMAVFIRASAPPTAIHQDIRHLPLPRCVSRIRSNSATTEPC